MHGAAHAGRMAAHDCAALLPTVCQMLREGEARIQLKPDEHCMWPLKDYSEMEAREAYERVAKFHGWPTQRRHS